MKKMNRTCIFCNRTRKKSKEHIWPEWMHTFLPIIGDANNTSEVNTFKWKEQTGAKKLKRQGHLTTKKLRVVCEDCNNGWMSKIESEAKPILEKILKNEEFHICAQKQNILALWVTLKSIVGEHAEQDTNVTPQNDRYLFMTQRTIPEYFAIYIGKHNEDSDTAWLRTSQTIARTKSGPNPPLGNLKRNMQSIAFICGPLFVYVIAIRENEIKAADFLNLPKLTRIFPEQLAQISWPLTQTLGSKDMGLAAWALDEMKNMQNVQYAGDLP
ncbi:hypothetical protein N9W34_00270 [Rickettsiales bacterium]|nr:hypothetical protein [Rickettsiales bacterium]